MPAKNAHKSGRVIRIDKSIQVLTASSGCELSTRALRRQFMTEPPSSTRMGLISLSKFGKKAVRPRHSNRRRGPLPLPTYRRATDSNWSFGRNGLLDCPLLNLPAKHSIHASLEEDFEKTYKARSCFAQTAVWSLPFELECEVPGQTKHDWSPRYIAI